MVTLEKLRGEIEELFEKDRNTKYVDIHADTLEEALADAAVQLDTRISVLEYEVLEQGFKGFATLLKKPWLIRVYENQKKSKKLKHASKEENSISDSLNADGVPKNADGIFHVHYFDTQVYLKVISPIGTGIPINFQAVMAKLQRADTISLEENEVKRYVKNSTGGVYEPVGQYTHNVAGDATLYVDISNDEMQATIVATAATIGGADISAARIERMLETQNISVGRSKEKIDEFVDNPVYGVPYVVAEGIVPVDGRDAYIVYNFEVDTTKFRVKESESGQVDFKELNRIQNVVEGQPLAQKMLPERGKSGKNLFGRYLEAKNGKDISLPMGTNVTLDTDERTILAAVNGQVLLINDKINVEPIMELDGISIKTGNVTFLGTVIIKGNVEDGFHVKASGNIEVYGTVGNSILEADGDIIVSLGIMGKDEGIVRAGKSLWAKFIQSATIEAEDFIVVQDGIINSNVTSNKKIFVQGKRATIIGGHLFATEEIHAKNIGSSAGASETILEVGYDPKAKKRLDELSEKQIILIKEFDEVELNLQTLENQKKLRKTLSHDKEEALIDLTNRKNDIHAEVDEMSHEIQQIQDHLRELKVVGKISASGAVHSGVKVHIRDVKEEIRNETKAVTFFYEDGFVRYGKYEVPLDEDAKRIPDGYSAN